MIYHHTLVFMHEAITVGLLRAQLENGLPYPTNDRLFLARTSSNFILTRDFGPYGVKHVNTL